MKYCVKIPSLALLTPGSNYETPHCSFKKIFSSFVPGEKRRRVFIINTDPSKRPMLTTLSYNTIITIFIRIGGKRLQEWSTVSDCYSNVAEIVRGIEETKNDPYK